MITETASHIDLEHLLEYVISSAVTGTGIFGWMKARRMYLSRRNGKPEGNPHSSHLTSAERGALFGTQEAVERIAAVVEKTDADGIPFIYAPRSTLRTIQEHQETILERLSKPRGG